MRMVLLSLLGASILVAGNAGSASAQSELEEVLVPGLGVITRRQVDIRTARLEAQYHDVKLAGPRAGVGINAVLFPAAALTIAVGATMISIDQTFCFGRPSPCGRASAGSIAVTSVGAAALIGSFVAMILMSRKLKKRKEARERIRREIDTLARAKPPSW